MDSELVSIIIPVYNVEKYLPQCVESVLVQTYQNIEVILVDDGSTDSSASLCDKLAWKDKRIKVIHKLNGGLSEARNTGTMACNGKWIFYLDSDDYLEKNAIVKLLEIQFRYNADIVIGNYYYTYLDYENIALRDDTEIKVYQPREAIVLLMQGILQTFAWGKLIRTDIAKRHLFPVGKLFEDHFWTHLIFQECDTIVYTSEPVIHYRQRETSISYTFNIKRLDIIDGWQERINFLKNKYPDLVEVYLERCAKDSLDLSWLVLTRMDYNKKEGFMIIRQFIKKYQLDTFCKGRTKKMLQALLRSNFKYALYAFYYRVIGE